MYLFISLAWILLFAAFISLIFKIKFEISLPFVFIGASLVLYIFSFFSQLKIGYYALWIPCIIVIFILVNIAFDKKDIFKLFINNYLSLPLFLFVIIYFAIFIIYRQSGFNHWDEFNHWGPMVREMIKYNTFYSIPESLMEIHKDYPPFFSLIGSLFCHFYHINYMESRMYIGHLTFMISLFFPIFSLFNLKERKTYLSLIFGIISIILFGFIIQSNMTERFYNCIVNDWPLSIFCAYTFFVILIYEDSLFKNINIAFCFWTLISMKQSGIAFCCLAILMLLIKDIIIDKKKNYIPIIAMVLVPIVTYMIWNYYIDSVGALEGAQFKLSQIKLSDFFNIARGMAGEEWQIISFKNFLNALTGAYIFIKPIKLSYVVSVLIVFVLMIIEGIINKNKNMYIVSSVFLFGSIAYALMMLLLYVFSFGKIEGPMLAAYNRYMISYVFFGISLLLMMAIYDSFNLDKSYIIKSISILIIVLLFADLSNLKDLRIRKYEDNMHNNEYYQELYNVLNGKKTLIVEQYSDNPDLYLYPMLNYDGIFENGTKFARIREQSGESGFDLRLNLNEWKALLNEYDYLFIETGDDYFINNYFNETSDDIYLNHGLYQINKSQGKVSLQFLLSISK